jgi:starch synthase
MSLSQHPSPRSAAISFEPEGYTTKGPRLMGRHAAGEGFLRAFAESETSASVWCHSRAPAARDVMAERLAGFGYRGAVHFASPTSHGLLASASCLYHPSPTLGELAWRRFSLDERHYSLCGVTHTTASHAVMSAISELLLVPVRSWDAVVCTSRVVRDSVRTQLEEQAAYLRWRVGARRLDTLQLPLIPLGVHAADFSFGAADRQAARAQLDMAADARAALFVGRLSFHAKAHPQAMYLALEQAAQQSGRPLHLVHCGWFANASIESAFREAAALLAPSVTMHFLDGCLDSARAQAWAAADFFISLSDNVQETFGLTPIEAMAAGLPVVVSDWNGYRDTVRDGIDGFRIPTLMPEAPLGQDLAARYADGVDNYDIYCGHVCELVAVDVAAAASACARLADDDALRHQMGQAGRERVRGHYDWSVVIQQYRALWQELDERRRSDADLAGAPARRVRADRMDPFALFATYPTRALRGGDVLLLRPGASATLLSARRQMAINRFARHVFPSEAECARILDQLATAGPCTADALLQGFAADRRQAVRRGLVWMVKMDVLAAPSVAPEA